MRALPRSLALIVSGEALQTLLAGEHGTRATERMLLEAALPCGVVIACRVSPRQKALLVGMVKDGVTPEPTTLAVGDGANDLGMLGLAGTGGALHAKPSVQAECDIRINHGDLTALLYLQGYSFSDFVDS